MNHWIWQNRCKYLPIIVITLSTIMSVSVSSITQAQGTAKFEAALDITIRSACHSYATDKLRDNLSWLKSLIYENSPFCSRIKTASDTQDINDAMQDEFKKIPKSGSKIDFSKKQERGMHITIDCRSEYMCMETRMKYLDSQNPVDQKSYNHVSAFCQERYGCIEAFFKDWPTLLPAHQPAETSTEVTFASILGSPDGQTPVAPPTPASTAPQTTATQLSATATSPITKTLTPKSSIQKAVEQPVKAKTQITKTKNPDTKTASIASSQIAQLIFGNNMTWNNAMRFCKSKGMHLPTIAEGKQRLPELRTRDPYLGIWTTDQNASDRIIGRYRTLRDNGYTDGQRATTSQRVICFP